MLKQWINITQKVLLHPHGLHTAGKFIAHNFSATLTAEELFTQDLTLDMLGFQKKKLTMLKDYYYHEESVKVALMQLAHRRDKGTYGSCGVTTYAHLSKKERPMQGPCIQSIVFTHLPSGVVNANVYYRTTEIFKKFSADLIFLSQIMLPQFNVDGDITLTMANATYHPMYWVVSAAHLPDPVASLKKIKQHDPAIHKGICRWTQRFISQPDSLLKFKQGYRVSKHLHRLIDSANFESLSRYITQELS